MAEMNIEQAADRACEEPTLAMALAWIAIWESGRVVRFARANPNDPWDTCFRLCFEYVLARYPPSPNAYEKCAGECDAQAEAISDSFALGSYDGLSDADHHRRSEMIGRREAYREMAIHFRAIGKKKSKQTEQAVSVARVEAAVSAVEEVVASAVPVVASAVSEVRRGVGALVGALQTDLDAARAEVAQLREALAAVERRPTVAEAEREFLRLRPVPDDEVAGRRVEDVCEAHGWATEGMPRRLVEAIRARHGCDGLTVCRGCVDRAKAEADRERQQVTP